MPQPTVFLAFSNDIDNPLSSLKWESQHIYKALSSLEDRGTVKIFREEHASTDDIIVALERFANPENNYQLEIFHFAGHADGKGIQLVDQQGLATGLARLLAQFKDSLALVFLNGCSTLEQVNLLLELGVKAVIATSAAIGDAQASQFAELFYRKLSSQSTLQQAFDFASDGMAFKGGQAPGKIAVSKARGLAWRQANMEGLPWGFYYAEDSAHRLGWQFRRPAEPGFSRPYVEEDIRINEYFLDVCWEMGKYKAEIQEKLDSSTITEGEQFELMIKHFPWLISTQVRVLLSSSPAMSTPTLGRLEQIISTYLSVGQLVYFISLSQLWGQKYYKKVGRIQLPLEDIFQLKLEGYPHFDYIARAGQLIGEFQHHPTASLFIEELKELKNSLQDQDECYQAYQYLESKRGQLLSGQVDALKNNIHEACLEAEYALSVMLCKIAFLAQYQMLTVRDIKLHKLRYQESASYFHFIGKLHAHMESSIIVSEEPQQYEQYLDDHSVILLRSLDQPEPFINLTPFIIDRNAFSEKNDPVTNLFTFAFELVPEGTKETQFYYVNSGQNLLRVAPGQMNEAHLFHTGFEPQLDPRNRRRMIRKKEENKLPYAPLKALFQQLKLDWQHE